MSDVDIKLTRPSARPAHTQIAQPTMEIRPPTQPARFTSPFIPRSVWHSSRLQDAGAHGPWDGNQALPYNWPGRLSTQPNDGIGE